MTETKNRRTATLLAGVAIVMVGMAYASVPLYRIFCQVTGFGGTTQTAQSNDVGVIEREITILFSASTHRDMPWTFFPQQARQKLKIGEQAIAHYQAVNPTDRTVTGSATFNVTPHKAGPYFAKIECFCFTEQTLEPGQKVDMPVTYFVDPAIAEDPNLDEVTEITLSYTFFVKNAPATHEATAGQAAGKAAGK